MEARGEKNISSTPLEGDLSRYISVREITLFRDSSLWGGLNPDELESGNEVSSLCCEVVLLL